MSSSASHTILASAGGIAGIIESIIVQPLELIKVRFQLNHGTNNNVSIFDCARSIIANEGGVSRLFRGLLPELCGMFPTRSVMYSSNEVCKRFLLGYNNNSSTSNNHNSSYSEGSSGEVVMEEEATTTTSIIAISGAFSGIAEAAVATPFQVVKLRLQAKEHLGKYTNSFDCIQKLYREEGMVAFSNGLSATMFRNSVFNCVYFTVIYKIKEVSPPTLPTDSKVKTTMHSFVSGFVGGVIATSFNAPFDVVKSRIQAQRHSKSGGMEYTSTIQALMKIGRTEGLPALYKGFQPKALRMGIGGAVAVTAFEAVCEIAHSLE